MSDHYADWYHRGPCTIHVCSICGSKDCYVWNDDQTPEVHVCAAGCDIPERQAQ